MSTSGSGAPLIDPSAGKMQWGCCSDIDSTSTPLASKGELSGAKDHESRYEACVGDNTESNSNAGCEATGVALSTRSRRVGGSPSGIFGARAEASETEGPAEDDSDAGEVPDSSRGLGAASHLHFLLDCKRDARAQSEALYVAVLKAERACEHYDDQAPATTAPSWHVTPFTCFEGDPLGRTLCSYVMRFFRYAECSECSVIIGLLYLDRISRMHPGELPRHNLP